MAEPLSVALLSFWHVHAPGYAAEVLGHPNTRLAAVWDNDAARGRDGAARLGVDFTDDLDGLLARGDIDGVIVTTATDLHHEVILKAVRAGKHVFTEKMLAPTVAQCEELVAAAADANVKLVVSLPRLSEAMTLGIRQQLEAGKLGRLTYTRVRMAHDGWVKNWLPERFADPGAAIGGALTDLGCHPVYLTQLFLGATPSTVSATYTSVTGRPVEDNAVVTLTYPNGAIGVIEASNVTTPGAGTFELRGTEGSLLSGFGNSALLAKGDHFDPETWTEITLPEAGPSPLAQWISAIEQDTDTEDNSRAAIELTRMIVAANSAAEHGRTLGYDLNAGTPA
jgi:1,5-anhydro-D-fructose reductase (1,5-anhydro-D-mannitol-forming)